MGQQIFQAIREFYLFLFAENTFKIGVDLLARNPRPELAGLTVHLEYRWTLARLLLSEFIRGLRNFNADNGV